MSSQDTFTALMVGFAALDGAQELIEDWSEDFWIHCAASALNGLVVIWGLFLLGVFA